MTKCPKTTSEHIPTKEILRDILETQIEINNYQDEKDVLMRNPPENKVRIYLLEGRILKREELIKKLNQIINDREDNK